MARKAELDPQEIAKRLSYDPLTGILTWRRNGKVAGYEDSHGYTKVMICGLNYYGHRLAWVLVHGEWPSAEIDHINGMRSDTRFANLRAATRQQNGCNLKAQSNTKSGVKGVCWDTYTNRWKAEIRANGVRKNLGRYDTIEEAASAYQKAALLMHGEFARVQ